MVVKDKYTGITIAYFIFLSFLLYLIFKVITYEFSPELMTRLEPRLSWTLQVTPRFFRNLQLVLYSFIFHCIVHFLARCCFKTFFERYYTLPFESRITLSEKVLSSIHGFVLGTVGINLVVIQGIWSEDLFGQYPIILDYIFCFSCGYEFYDLGTMIAQDIKSPRYNENVFWIHHTSMLLGYTIVMIKKKMAFVAAILIITELTVIPSNLHWYLKAFGYRDTRAFHFNQGLRLWSFLILRLFIAPVIFLQLCLHYDQFWNEDILTKIATIIITALLGVMNVNWTSSMLKLYRKRTRLRDKRAKLREQLQQQQKQQ